MTHSEALNELASALAKAQAMIEGAKKDTENPFFGKKYADLASVWDACRGQLTANGLSVVQMPFTSAEGIGVRTMLLHSSGQWITSEVVAEPKDRGPQSVVAVTTYLRRAGLSSMAGVPQVDDDGETAEGRGKPSTKVAAAPHTASGFTPVGSIPYQVGGTGPHAAPPPAPVPFDSDNEDENPWDEPTTPAYSQSQNPAVFVKTIKRAASKPGAPRPWRAVFAVLEDGREVATFDEVIAETLETARANHEGIYIKTEPSKKDPSKTTVTEAVLAKDMTF